MNGRFRIIIEAEFKYNGKELNQKNKRIMFGYVNQAQTEYKKNKRKIGPRMDHVTEFLFRFFDNDNIENA